MLTYISPNFVTIAEPGEDECANDGKLVWIHKYVSNSLKQEIIITVILHNIKKLIGTRHTHANCLCIYK